MTASGETESADDSETADENEGLDLDRFDTSEYRSRTGSFGSSALTHEHVPDGLQWSIEGCVTDRDEEAPMEPDTNSISLVGEDWEELHLTVEVELPEQCYDLVFPDGGDSFTGRLGLVYSCPETILRGCSETVEIENPGTHELELSLRAQRVSQSVFVEPALVRRGTAESGSEEAPDTDTVYAWAGGHRLAEGEQWSIEVSLEQSLTNLLHPETKSFEDDEELPGDDHLSFVALDRDPPKLYLNGDHERIVAALDSDANKGWDADVRDLTYDMIEVEFWPQLLLSAAADITPDGGPEADWKRGVIEKFREDIYGDDTSYEEALDLLYEDVTNPERLGRLMQDIDRAIQSRNDSPSHLDQLFRRIDSRNDG